MFVCTYTHSTAKVAKKGELKGDFRQTNSATIFAFLTCELVERPTRLFSVFANLIGEIEQLYISNNTASRSEPTLGTS